MDTAIELQHICKSFRQGWARNEVQALSNLTLSVSVGEAFGFIGQNGAGKSTTIKILTGALRHDSGQARLFGVNVMDYRSRKGMGYVPENPWLYEYLTPREILTMGIAAHGHRKGYDMKSYAMGWLERFDLGRVADRAVRGFSKGMLQRTALAHALAGEPRLLILDEPLSGLDPVGRREVVDILLDYRRNGGTLFFSSHVLHDVERLADRFGLIHKGHLHSVQQPAEVWSSSEAVFVRSIGEGAVAGMQPDVGGRWSGEVRPDGLWDLMVALREAGHTLLEVKPSMSLEKLFLDVVRRNH